MRNRLTVLALFLVGLAPCARAQGTKVEVMPVRSGAPSPSMGGNTGPSQTKPLNTNTAIKMQPVPQRTGVPNAATAPKAAVPTAPAANASGASYSTPPRENATGVSATAAPAFGRETSSPGSSAKPAKATAMDAAGNLEKTVREIKTREALTGGPSPVVEDAFRPIFDAASPVKTSAPEASSVAGKVQDVKSYIAHQVELGNTAPAANAPSFYAAAIKTAGESFTKTAAEQMTAVVLKFAQEKAQTALPQLAEHSAETAASGDSTKFATAFKAIGSWNGLFAGQGKSLIARFGDLRAANVEKVLRTAAGKPSGGGISGQAAKAAAAAVSHKQREEAKKWLVRKPGASEFVIALPVVSIGADLAGTLVSSKQEESVSYAEEAPSPSASDYKNFKVIYGTLRKEGVSRFGSFSAAGRYWVKSSWAQARRATRDTSPSEASFSAFNRLRDQRAEALDFIALHSSYLDLRSARVLLGQGRQAAESFRDLTGDGSALSAFADLERRVEAQARLSGLAEQDRLAPALSHLLLSGRGYGVRYWLERIYDKALEQPAILNDSRLLGLGRPEKELGAAQRATLRAGAALRIRALLADVRLRPEKARRLAASVQSQDLEYVRVGQVGDYLAQSARARSEDGRLTTITVLADPKAGRVVFARAE